MAENKAAEYRAACDPGWNDPPLFSYDSHSQALPKRPSLNKRVMFPVTADTKSQPLSSQGLPPKQPPGHVETLDSRPPPTPIHHLDVRQVSSTTEGNQESLEEISLSLIMDNFNLAVVDSCTKLSEKQAAEVKRRLDSMKTLWEENKFNPSIKEKILKLSEGVKNGDFDGADELQRSLMVDYPSLCSPWMSGVRHLLNSKRSNIKQ